MTNLTPQTPCLNDMIRDKKRRKKLQATHQANQMDRIGDILVEKGLATRKERK